MAKRYETTTTITTALRSLGLRSRKSTKDGGLTFADFNVLAIKNSAGERISTNVSMLSPKVGQKIWEHRDEIERMTAEAGYPFYVRKIRYTFSSEGAPKVYLAVSNASYMSKPQDETLIDVPLSF